MAATPDIKLVLLGHKDVGKTSVFNRYVYGEFGETEMTIGAYFALKQCRIAGDRSYSLAIWDTAGEERFDSMTNFYCRNAKAAIICYDVTDRATFTGLQRWVDKIAMEAEPNCAVVILGNKVDLVSDPERREVTRVEAEKYAAKMGAELFEASAATGDNIEEAFQSVVKSCVKNQGGSGAGGASGVRLKKGKSKRGKRKGAEPDGKDGKCC